MVATHQALLVPRAPSDFPEEYIPVSLGAIPGNSRTQTSELQRRGARDRSKAAGHTCDKKCTQLYTRTQRQCMLVLVRVLLL